MRQWLKRLRPFRALGIGGGPFSGRCRTRRPWRLSAADAREVARFASTEPGAEPTPSAAKDAAAARALLWIRRHTVRGEGVRITSRRRAAYPEVSGYLIPTLLAWGEERLARQYARWLAAIQNADGSWNGPDPRGDPYTFDTGQVLKGLLAIRDRMPETEEAILRGCEWLSGRIGPSGRITTPAQDAHVLADGSLVPGAVHLYALEPLRAAAAQFARPEWSAAVARAVVRYKEDPSLCEFRTLSHFHAYIVEALVDLGETDLARAAMARMEAFQRPDGAIPAYPRVEWVCSTGLAQYALIWLKLGGPDELARRALAWLRAHQNPSGGFFGSYGCGANYFPDAEIGWAAKFFLDAARLLPP